MLLLQQCSGVSIGSSSSEQRKDDMLHAAPQQHKKGFMTPLPRTPVACLQSFKRELANSLIIKHLNACADSFKYAHFICHTLGANSLYHGRNTITHVGCGGAISVMTSSAAGEVDKTYDAEASNTLACLVEVTRGIKPQRITWQVGVILKALYCVTNSIWGSSEEKPLLIVKQKAVQFAELCRTNILTSCNKPIASARKTVSDNMGVSSIQVMRS